MRAETREGRFVIVVTLVTCKSLGVVIRYSDATIGRYILKKNVLLCMVYGGYLIILVSDNSVTL